jgi:L-lactate dehydrogenase
VLSGSNLVHGAYGIDDVYLSLPAVVGQAGIERVLQLELSAQEQTDLRHSAAVLRSTIDVVRTLWAPANS